MDRTAHAGPQTPSDGEHRDQVIVLRGISWEQYDALLRARGESSQPLMAYLDGELELVTTSPRHEWIKTVIARLLEAYAEETGVSLNGFGNATVRKKAKKAGLEPDEWYCIGPTKPAPDLAIEIVHSSGGIDKLEIYRRLKAAEVWFWIDNRFWIYELVDRHYVERKRSVALPKLDLAAIIKIVLSTDEAQQTEAVRAYRRTLRRR